MTNIAGGSSATGAAANSHLVFGKDDALFGCIERQQGSKPFGSLLDAGTGVHSLRWIATLKEKGMTDFTAVTADETMQRNCQRECDSLESSDSGTVMIGNWFDEKLPIEFKNKKFDVILADYLVGAMDGFSPYTQDQMIPKLAALLKPGGRLYIVGLQPIPDKVPETCIDESANIICKVRQVRDACILLAGHRCYREYPKDWILRQLVACSDLSLRHSKEFPILYRHATIVKQINVGRSKLKFMDEALMESMGKVLDNLEMESLQATTKTTTGRIQLGFDYVVSAEKIK